MITSTPIQRLKTKTSIEVLWPYILALMTSEPIYAYEIREKIENRFGFSVGNVTSYMVLYKLESSGLVTTEWRNVENRQRKYYRITEEGRKALDESIVCFKEIVAKLESRA